MKTRFIYFDLGKVILDFDHAIGCRNVAEHCGVSPNAVHAALFDSGLEVRFETGEFTPEAFCELFFEAVGGRCQPEQLLEGMSDIFTPNLEIFPLIEQLHQQQFPIGILSNTCHAHWSWVKRHFSIIGECFSTRILSYEEKSMKPDHRIFQAAIAASGCEPGEIFFMDDRPDNVEGALAAGLDAVIYTSVGELRDEISRRQIFDS
ncbi:MAG: HAD family phosphatase [Planctomycetota bacterium]